MWLIGAVAALLIVSGFIYFTAHRTGNVASNQPAGTASRSPPGTTGSGPSR